MTFTFNDMKFTYFLVGGELIELSYILYFTLLIKVGFCLRMLSVMFNNIYSISTSIKVTRNNAFLNIEYINSGNIGFVLAGKKSSAKVDTSYHNQHLNRKKKDEEMSGSLLVPYNQLLIYYVYKNEYG